jgi:carbonic anhydrase/acetyltransferase-like protein (isoleucine patch superfamily)
MIIRPFNGISPKIDPSAFIAEGAVIIGDVRIGPGASIWYGCVVRGDVNRIRIGANTNIQDGTVIHVSREDFPTVIEDEVTIGHGAMIHGCTIERGSLIGIGAIVLDGAVVGAESFIAAGSLVTPGTVVPPRSMMMGSPAKVKKILGDDEVAQVQTFWQNYVTLSEIYMAEDRD